MAFYVQVSDATFTKPSMHFRICTIWRKHALDVPLQRNYSCICKFLFCRLTEIELETNPRLYGCIPKGLPLVTTECGIENGKALCELMGTITFETAVKGVCSNEPNIGKRCADYHTVRRFINEGKNYEGWYKSHGDSSNGQSQVFHLTTICAFYLCQADDMNVHYL